MKDGLRFCAPALLLLVNGCAVHKYHPAPISTAALLPIFESKSLSNPALKTYIEASTKASVPVWPLAHWDLDRLTLAAYFYSPDLDEARAQAATTQAAVVTAAARPNPTVGLGGGDSSAPESPYLWNVDVSIPIETAGKRGYRIVAAQQLSEAARLGVGITAWQVRMKVRTALLDYLISKLQVAALREEDRRRSTYVALLEGRVKAGEIGRPDANLATLDLTNTRLALGSALGRVEASRSTLAAEIGLPVTELRGLDLIWPSLKDLPDPSLPQIQHEAALNRLDLQQALAEYEAEDANLRLQIAKQYPDLQIGPHADHQEGFNNFSLGVSLELPLLNRNQGPIAEAEARRTKVAAHLRTLQANIISESNVADANYRSALEQLHRADADLNSVQARILKAANRSVQRGEEDRLFAESAEIQAAVTARASIDALESAQRALGALEDAVQRPLNSLEQGTFQDPHALEPATSLPGRQ